MTVGVLDCIRVVVILRWSFDKLAILYQTLEVRHVVRHLLRPVGSLSCLRSPLDILLVNLELDLPPVQYVVGNKSNNIMASARPVVDGSFNPFAAEKFALAMTHCDILVVKNDQRSGRQLHFCF